jgi:hypothetical protein
MPRAAVYCSRCFGYLRTSKVELEWDDYEAEPIVWIEMCDCCKAGNPPGKSRGLLSRCAWCGVEYAPTRQGQRVHSASCRARSWRSRRAAA